MAAGVWTGVRFSNLKNFPTRTLIRIEKFRNKSGVGGWKNDSGHLWFPLFIRVPIVVKLMSNIVKLKIEYSIFDHILRRRFAMTFILLPFYCLISLSKLSAFGNPLAIFYVRCRIKHYVWLDLGWGLGWTWTMNLYLENELLFYVVVVLTLAVMTCSILN